MRIDALTVVLRPRSSWEAIELGTALVRRHAAAIWRPWFALTLPVLIVANLVAWSVGMPALAMLLVWWLKPVFDRIPLFVLSRAVFGEVPDTRTTLSSAFAGGFRLHAGYLLWRRLTPLRSLVMPIDVLEGGTPAEVAARRRVVAGPVYGVASLAMLVFANFEGALVIGLAALIFLFVPNEYMQVLLQLLWRSVREAPAWLQVTQGVLAWAAMTVTEPFYVGSGFGLYLNRRTGIEGWDIELAFRRMRARLQGVASVGLLMMLLMLVVPHAGDAAASGTLHTASRDAAAASNSRDVRLVAIEPASAAVASASPTSSVSTTPIVLTDSIASIASNAVTKLTASIASRLPHCSAASTASGSGCTPNPLAAVVNSFAVSTSTTGPTTKAPMVPRAPADPQQCPRPRTESSLRSVFGTRFRDTAPFAKSVDRAFEGPELKPRRKVMAWQPRHPSKVPDHSPPPFLAWLARAFGSAFEVVMWLLAAAFVLTLVLTAKRWWPWLRAQVGDALPPARDAQQHAIVAIEPLRRDIAAASRRLWAGGQRREALALLYRGAVGSLEAARGNPLPAGATEAQALRASAALADVPRSVFARVVRSWQYAAYADRWPEAAAFDALVADASTAFAWPR